MGNMRSHFQERERIKESERERERSKVCRSFQGKLVCKSCTVDFISLPHSPSFPSAVLQLRFHCSRAFGPNSMPSWRKPSFLSVCVSLFLSVCLYPPYSLHAMEPIFLAPPFLYHNTSLPFSHGTLEIHTQTSQL